MHQYGICHLPLAPMRANPDDTSEMVSQILFGQSFDILDTSNPRWTLIRCHSDFYQGYIGNKQYLPVTKENLETLSFRRAVNKHRVRITQVGKGIKFDVPLGSELPPMKKFRFGEMEFQHNYTPASLSLAETALSFLNAPYLWGGKTLFGIDCSGFTQTVFAAHNTWLPRDASQQAEQGTSLPDLRHAQPGDLAFFQNNEGRVIHVGILLENQRIIHASGCVRIDKIDEKGIFNEEIGQYTHQLHSLAHFSLSTEFFECSYVVNPQFKKALSQRLETFGKKK